MSLSRQRHITGRACYRTRPNCLKNQLEFWGNSVKHYLEASQALAKGKLEAPEDFDPDRSTFRQSPFGRRHPYFNYVKQQYMLNAEAIRTAVENVDGPERHGSGRGWITLRSRSLT